MKSATQISDSIAFKIGDVYLRPLIHGGTAEGVDLVLFCYHGIWAEIHGLEDELRTARFAVSEHQKLGSMSFAKRYKRRYPKAREQKAAAYVTSQWRRISEMIGVPIPYD